LRWFNYHLKAAGHNRRVKNFTSDIKVITQERNMKRRNLRTRE
jgi:hypothetical protein